MRNRSESGWNGAGNEYRAESADKKGDVWVYALIAIAVIVPYVCIAFIHK